MSSSDKISLLGSTLPGGQVRRLVVTPLGSESGARGDGSFLPSGGGCRTLYALIHVGGGNSHPVDFGLSGQFDHALVPVVRANFPDLVLSWDVVSQDGAIRLGGRPAGLCQLGVLYCILSQGHSPLTLRLVDLEHPGASGIRLVRISDDPQGLLSSLPAPVSVSALRGDLTVAQCACVANASYAPPNQFGLGISLHGPLGPSFMPSADVLNPDIVYSLPFPWYARTEDNVVVCGTIIVWNEQASHWILERSVYGNTPLYPIDQGFGTWDLNPPLFPGHELIPVFSRAISEGVEDTISPLKNPHAGPAQIWAVSDRPSPPSCGGGVRLG